MKKVVLFLFVALFAFASFAQDRAATLNSTKYYYEFTLAASDTVTNNDTIWEAQILVNKAEPVKYNIQIDLEKTSGSPDVTATLKGKIFSSDSWTDITAVTWAATTSDTTIAYTQVTTAQYYRYFKITLDGTTAAQKTTVSAIRLKFWDK